MPADPFAERGALPRSGGCDARCEVGSYAAPPLMAGVGGAAVAHGTATKSPPRPVRTALTIEPRDGRLCVFMPPAEQVEDYLDLLAAVEATAADLNLPILVEGYLPPPDPRINVIKVTPDPGVIEVNIHPASSWREAVDITRTLYEEARLCRLGADKFMIDGRHTGTGGGNHVVLGGQAAADSPFLRRPDLLKSLILYCAAPSVAVLSVLRPVHRADQPGAARRRGAAGPALRTRHCARRRCRRRARASSRGRGWSIGCSAICWSTSPATRIAPKSASTSCSRPMVRPAGSAWSNSARSRCRRMRA